MTTILNEQEHNIANIVFEAAGLFDVRGVRLADPIYEYVPFSVQLAKEPPQLANVMTLAFSGSEAFHVANNLMLAIKEQLVASDESETRANQLRVFKNPDAPQQGMYGTSTIGINLQALAEMGIDVEKLQQSCKQHNENLKNNIANRPTIMNESFSPNVFFP